MQNAKCKIQNHNSKIKIIADKNYHGNPGACCYNYLISKSSNRQIVKS